MTSEATASSAIGRLTAALHAAGLDQRVRVLKMGWAMGGPGPLRIELQVDWREDMPAPLPAQWVNLPPETNSCWDDHVVDAAATAFRVNAVNELVKAEETKLRGAGRLA